MNKPRLSATCWECKTVYKITRKRLEQVGEFGHCHDCDLKFRAWLTATAYTQK